MPEEFLQDLSFQVLNLLFFFTCSPFFMLLLSV